MERKAREVRGKRSRGKSYERGNEGKSKIKQGIKGGGIKFEYSEKRHRKEVEVEGNELGNEEK